MSFYRGSSGFDTSPYTHLEWAINTRGRSLSDFSVLLTDTTANANVLAQVVLSASHVTATLPNGWVRVAVPVSQLNPANVRINSVQLKNATANRSPTIYIDDVQFVRR